MADEIGNKVAELEKVFRDVERELHNAKREQTLMENMEKWDKELAQTLEEFEKLNAMPKAAKPKAAKPKAEQAAAKKPKAEKPKAEKPKAAKPKAEKPKAEKPKAAKPNAAKPNAAKPNAAKPNAAKPNAEKPKAAKPKAGQAAAKPKAGQAAAKKPKVLTAEQAAAKKPKVLTAKQVAEKAAEEDAKEAAEEDAVLEERWKMMLESDFPALPQANGVKDHPHQEVTFTVVDTAGKDEPEKDEPEEDEPEKDESDEVRWYTVNQTKNGIYWGGFWLDKEGFMYSGSLGEYVTAFGKFDPNTCLAEIFPPPEFSDPPIILNFNPPKNSNVNSEVADTAEADAKAVEAEVTAEADAKAVEAEVTTGANAKVVESVWDDTTSDCNEVNNLFHHINQVKIGDNEPEHQGDVQDDWESEPF